MNSESIVGGERTKFGDFPFMALLGKVYQKVFIKDCTEIDWFLIH